MQNTLFPVSLDSLFSQYQNNQDSIGKKRCRSSRDWFLNIKRTLNLTENMDFLKVQVRGRTGYVFEYWFNSPASEKICNFIVNPRQFYKSVKAATNKFSDAFVTGEYHCNFCNRTQPVEEFNVQKTRSGSPYLSRCKECYKTWKSDLRTERYKDVRNSLQVPYWNTKSRARKHGWSHDFDVDFLVELWHRQDGKCFYTGLPMEHQRIAKAFYAGGGFKKNSHNIASVDRVDSDKGYTRDNVVLCLWCVNVMKIDLTYEEFLKTAQAVVEHARNP